LFVGKKDGWKTINVAAATVRRGITSPGCFLENVRKDVLMKWKGRVQVGEVYILSSRQASVTEDGLAGF